MYTLQYTKYFFSEKDQFDNKTILTITDMYEEKKVFNMQYNLQSVL